MYFIRRSLMVLIYYQSCYFLPCFKTKQATQSYLKIDNKSSFIKTLPYRCVQYGQKVAKAGS